MKQGKKTYRPSLTEDSIAVIIKLCKTQLVTNSITGDSEIVRGIIHSLSPFLAKVQNGAVSASYQYSVNNPKTTVEQRLGISTMPTHTMESIEEKELAAYQSYVSCGRCIELLSLDTIDLITQYLCKNAANLSLSETEQDWIDKKYQPWLFDSNGSRITEVTE